MYVVFNLCHKNKIIVVGNYSTYVHMTESSMNNYFRNGLVKYNFENKWEIIKTYLLKNNISFPLSLANFLPYVKMKRNIAEALREKFLNNYGYVLLEDSNFQ